MARGTLGSLTCTVLLAACADGDSSVAPTTPIANTRTWTMGFSTNPSRPSVGAVVEGIDQWNLHAEYAAIHEEVPRRDLLAGMTPDAIIDRDKVQLVAYLRGKGLKLHFVADPTDGLSHAQEAPQRRALGHSLAERDAQQAYRAYVFAATHTLQSGIIGLSAETNLVRAAASPALYAAVVRIADDADLRAAGSSATLFAGVQVETAWGMLGGGAGGTGYVGIERDLTDFPFVQWPAVHTSPTRSRRTFHWTTIAACSPAERCRSWSSKEAGPAPQSAASVRRRTPRRATSHGTRSCSTRWPRAA